MLDTDLNKQLKQNGLSEDHLPQDKKQWQTFLATVNNTYISSASPEKTIRLDGKPDEAEIVKKSKLKSYFIEYMSHEIRTSIHSVLGSLELIKDSKNLAQQEQMFINAALMSGGHLLDIANNILDFSRINAGRLKLEETSFNIRELLADINHVVAAISADKGLMLTTQVSDNIPERIRGDSAKLRQIIMNLANKAIKFTHEGKITLQAQLLKQNGQETILRFEITDSGIGIPASKVEKILSAFRNPNASLIEQFEVIGLGLSISKELVQLMGGNINLESVEGKGTHFWIDVPFKSVDIKYQEKNSNDTDLSKLKVLVIEQQRTTHALLDHYFSMWGIEYEFTDNCGDAIEKLYQGIHQLRAFDVIMIDYYMPGIECFELNEMLNTHPDFQSVSKITLSSYNLAEQEREIANIEFCLVKPIRDVHLKEILKACLSIKNKDEQSDESPTSACTDILLAEDNSVNALLAIAMVEQIGLSVKHVTNGQQAINEIKNNHFKLVLMDMHMPVMDGYKATRKIRQWEATTGRTAIPVIALTANALVGDKEKCLSAGMDDYISKPIKQKELQQLVSKWANKSC